MVAAGIPACMVSCDFAQQLFRALEQGSALDAEVMLLAQELGISAGFAIKKLGEYGKMMGTYRKMMILKHGI